MLQQISFCLCIGLITCVQIGCNRISCSYQITIFLIRSNQICVSLISLGNLIDVGVVLGVVRIYVSVNFLTKVVLRVTVVSAPAVDDEGVQVRCNNLSVDAGNIGTNVQLDIVIAQSIGEGLRQYICCI